MKRADEREGRKGGHETLDSVVSSSSTPVIQGVHLFQWLSWHYGKMMIHLLCRLPPKRLKRHQATGIPKLLTAFLEGLQIPTALRYLASSFDQKCSNPSTRPHLSALAPAYIDCHPHNNPAKRHNSFKRFCCGAMCSKIWP